MTAAIVLGNLAVQAMDAGLDGKPMPDFGTPLKPDWIELLNTVYAIARKRSNLALQTK